ncbi:MAG: malto-oligosyltrehalose synthase [Opitutus sp.]|nr:malto-oligosyltrehalose synthase [Opitutus sp.]
MSRADWIATYRLQLTADFPLAAAARVVPYLAELGISHVYLSPVLQSAPGSTHGYDVTDPTQISDQLGGEAAWAEFVRVVRAHGLGILLDIVPNHMAAVPENSWWDDVLRHGPASRYAPFFDITPRPEDGGWLVHLCPLGRRYGEALKAGELQVVVKSGAPRLTYFEHSWPLTPASVGACSQATTNVPASASVPNRLQAGSYKSDAALETELAALNADPARLHALLEQQHYRLHHWKLEGELTNYRRFFDVGRLVGVRQEIDEVFAATHARIRRMIEAGEIDGLRIDHPDGLADPFGYLERLRALAPGARIYVEKILDDDEALRGDWPVEGTVGYDFLSHVNRLWMEGQSIDALSAAYADFTKQSINFPVIAREKQRLVADRNFGADLQRLTTRALQLAQRDWRHRDLSPRQLREAIARLTTALPVYRSYRTAAAIRTEDRQLISEALAAARMIASDVAPAVFDFLEAILLAPSPDAAELDWILRWQQLSPAVAAKGIEDTTFYVYDRLVSGNEVGAKPSSIGIASEKFHEFCHHIAERWPDNLLATATHDNKRGEDVRTRISLLTEVPDRWSAALHEWSQLTTSAWKGRTPDRHAEYLLYQTMIGAWPIAEERCWAYMQKACREAKIRTSWHEPNPGYEEAIREFIAGIYASPDFLRHFEGFVAPLLPAGRINSLGQALIKLTAPGVPDFYQGTELWDLSLVDPDNRRPVNYAQRGDLLARCPRLAVQQVMEQSDAGLPKLWLIARTLQLRRERPDFFGRTARYRPLVAQGAQTSHLFAFQRGENLITAVPRFTLTLGGDWGDTHLQLPPGRWQNWLTQAWLSEDVGAAQLFHEFPVALLVRVEV